MSKISEYFTGFAVKRLSAVEADPATSNQHEFNGVKQLSKIFGEEKTSPPCHYLYLGASEEETATAEGALTWYDARERHPLRTEYRLYYQWNSVMERANEGDLLVIGRRPDGSALTLVARQGSTFERQVLWLFDIVDEGRTFTVTPIEDNSDREIGFAERTILETLGIEVAAPQTNLLGAILDRFGTAFPTTRKFSDFARGMLPEVSAKGAPDAALILWINHEETLFRALEKHIVEGRVKAGFATVEDFVEFSLSVHNRRKSRVGFALENHLEQVFIENGIAFSRGQATENKAKPDFIFPHIDRYRDMGFPPGNLSMLGAKSTCKDRWRQVLTEAARIEQKHLFTLEPSISPNQTDEMRASKLQLVLPQALHGTYLPSQQAWLMGLSEFIALVKQRQA